jgi:hypothetical protein
MDINSVQITQRDIDRVLAQAAPADAAGFTGDACSIFRQAKPILVIAIGILKFVYPPGAAALSAAVAILEQACGS